MVAKWVVVMADKRVEKKGVRKAVELVVWTGKKMVDKRAAMKVP